MSTRIALTLIIISMILLTAAARISLWRRSDGSSKRSRPRLQRLWGRRRPPRDAAISPGVAESASRSGRIEGRVNGL